MKWVCVSTDGAIDSTQLKWAQPLSAFMGMSIVPLKKHTRENVLDSKPTIALSIAIFYIVRQLEVKAKTPLSSLTTVFLTVLYTTMRCALSNNRSICGKDDNSRQQNKVWHPHYKNWTSASATKRIRFLHSLSRTKHKGHAVQQVFPTLCPRATLRRPRLFLAPWWALGTFQQSVFISHPHER